MPDASAHPVVQRDDAIFAGVVDPGREGEQGVSTLLVGWAVVVCPAAVRRAGVIVLVFPHRGHPSRQARWLRVARIVQPAMRRSGAGPAVKLTAAAGEESGGVNLIADASLPCPIEIACTLLGTITARGLNDSEASFALRDAAAADLVDG